MGNGSSNFRNPRKDQQKQSAGSLQGEKSRVASEKKKKNTFEVPYFTLLEY